MFWGASASLEAGAIAQGEIVPAGRIKSVQHLEGGIIKALHVKDGDLVKTGQLLIELDDIEARASLLKNESQIKTKLKEAQRELDAWIRKGKHLQTLADTAQKEWEINKVLGERLFISPVRLLQLQSRITEIKVNISENEGEISRAKQKIEDINATLGELKVSKDKLFRTQIKAPQSGIISDLRFVTVGGVIPAGSIVLNLVPDTEDLLVEAHVRADDIDSVYLGLESRVKLTAYKSRTQMELLGRVIHISGTTFREERGDKDARPFYKVNIQLIDRKPQSHQLLTPGMLAEVYIISGRRSPLRYLFDPIFDSIEKSFYEK